MNDNGLNKAAELFPDMNIDEIDFSDLIGGWKDVSSADERLPSVGWPDINGELVIQLYFDGESLFDMAVVDQGGVKERHEKSKISEANQMILWLLVREDTIRKCTAQINRKMDQKEIYDVIKNNVDNVNKHGFIGEIESSEIYYGGDILIECLEYFGLDPYKKY
jgi:hypothetical protein